MDSSRPLQPPSIKGIKIALKCDRCGNAYRDCTHVGRPKGDCFTTDTYRSINDGTVLARVKYQKPYRRN